MPDKPLTIATYAAGASLAAITLVYVFGPTFFLDDESANSSSSSRKKGVVGLSNPANDCFINSVLQALAGLGDLRTYLIRELHRRKLDGPELYNIDAARLKKEPNLWKINGLQQGLVTEALKEVLDKLNERPIYKKTISAQRFIVALEKAFRTRISRQQQDAQEFLQLVAERLCDEYHAGTRARRKARTAHLPEIQTEEVVDVLKNVEKATSPSHKDVGAASLENGREKETSHNGQNECDEDGFPLEGKVESQVECLTCRFKPKPSESSFVTLTLNVPYEPSTTLNHCFDVMLKIEHIDDYTCDKCRLQHAIEVKQRELDLARLSEADKERLKYELSKIEDAIIEDPEKPPKDVNLPTNPPKRRIARHMRFTQYPQVLAIHLSRSVFDPGSISTKNMAKVEFPETLPLGGILDQKKYKLVAVVSHIGGHNSGHYESFRRQLIHQPYSTPHSFGADGAYSISASPNPSAIQSPRASADANGQALGVDSIPSPSTPGLSPSDSSFSSRPSTSSIQKGPAPTSLPRQDVPGRGGHSRTASTSQDKVDGRLLRTQSISEKMRLKRKAKSAENRWWRISDEKVKESKTSEVLSQQKGVYLLFYTLVKSRDDL
ncbi:MAG: hypothetical protein M1822_002733 [Bathelium mastoideum]|nr:MAG: hypothetical protein M1822_002733 [Bathelium mastoideum]